MAAAEARAAWQRTANRCFVQEDAKRAPKLACCPSPSSSSKLQSSDAAYGHIIPGFVPLNWNPSSSSIPPDTKWWLQLQPNFRHQKEFTYEQLNVLEAELESLRSEEMKQTSKLNSDSPASEEDTPHTETKKIAGSSLEPLCRVSANCVKNVQEATWQVLKAANGTNMQPMQRKDTGEFWYRDEGLMDMEPINQFISKEKEKLFDMESPWSVSEKTVPWWRTVDKDELASLVAQKSLEHIENCDLPPPQTMHLRRGPFACVESLSQDGVFTSLDQKVVASGLCNSSDHSWNCPTCGSLNGKQRGAVEKGPPIYGLDRALGSSSANNRSMNNMDMTEGMNISDSEQSKAQLMEALCHSQTRAREAEQAAQQACNEKEHIVKLFFRQASHLFAYKQWLQLLQLETIYLQLKNSDQPISALFPVALPWMPYKGRQWKKGKHRTRKGKHGASRHDICRYAVAFAVWLGLAGAGLLLGWTMGWLLPII